MQRFPQWSTIDADLVRSPFTGGFHVLDLLVGDPAGLGEAVTAVEALR